MSDRARLTVAQQQKLADALLSCECILNRRVRDQLLHMLQQNSVGQYGTFVRQDLDRADVIGILAVLTRHSGGLHALLEHIDFFEPGSHAAARVREIIELLEPEPLLSIDQRSTLEHLLSTIACPEAEQLYWEAVGTFGPPPTRPGQDLAGLARDLGDVVGAGPLPPVIIFLELIAARTLTHRTLLQQWVDDYARQHHIDPLAIAHFRVGLKNRASTEVSCYLVVQLEPYGADAEQYLLAAWFQQGSVSKKLRQEDEPIRIDELADIIDFLLTREAEVTRDAASRLVVEMVLPRQLINWNIDQWTIAPAGFERAVGIQHPMVVRPIERHLDPALHRVWRQKWQWLKEYGSDPRAVPAALHWISRPDEVDPRQLMVQLMGEGPPVCIGMGFAPPPANGLGMDEFAAGIHSGAPVIIWCRDSREAEEFEREIRALLASQSLLAIPDLVHRHRQRAHFPHASPHHLGRHLTLLWDDYDRRPQEPTSLFAPAKGEK